MKSLDITLSLLLILSLTCPLPHIHYLSYNSYHNISTLSIYGSFGVNLYGWIRGDFGGGTTARCVLKSLLANNVPVSAITVNGAALHSHTNKIIENSHLDTRVRDYMFSLLIINAANTVPVMKDPDNAISHNQYRIGLWHWETSRLPIEQGAAGRFYDEIWVPSQYVADAVLATPSFPRHQVRVKVIPYGYEHLPDPISTTRRQQARSRLLDTIPGYSETQQCTQCTRNTLSSMRRWADPVSSATLFLAIFDFNSDSNRKNIEGIIRAFRSVFPNSGHSVEVGLILKSSHASHQPGDYEHLKWVIENKEVDDRVVMMDGVLPTHRLLDLKAAVDCYISLHRSEGWGLNILEGVLAGTPIISTAFGGSEQFMQPLYESRAPELRIPYSLVNVSREFGPYTTDMLWADPDLGAAGHALRQVHLYLPRYRAMAAEAREHAVNLLSPMHTGEGMVSRLRLLQHCICAVKQKYGVFVTPCSGSGDTARTQYKESSEHCMQYVLGQRMLDKPNEESYFVRHVKSLGFDSSTTILLPH